MKTMTCYQLGGACAKEFHAETFDEMAELSKQHGMEMHRMQDKDHLEAMQRMQESMQNPAEMQSWFEPKKQEFEAPPHN